MSSHDIFAAQMWPWPDPLLKRDMQGRILFVNAAFLQLYGGQVHDWHGNTLGGWPAPQPSPTPTRFDTSAPGALGPDGQAGPGRVYDWIEHCLSDGGALCIGRDVTDLLSAQAAMPAQSAMPAQAQGALVQNDYPAQTSAPIAAAPAMTAPPMTAPPLSAPDIAPQIQNTMQVAEAAPLSQPPAASAQEYSPPPMAQAPQMPEPSHEPVSYEPIAAEPVAAEPITEEPVAAQPSIDEFLSPVEETYIPAETAATQSAEPPAQPLVEEYIPLAETPASPSVDMGMIAPTLVHENPQMDNPPATQERETERRALPVESSSSVLGNNWRDAVIAKAVGGTPDTPAETPATPTPAPAGESGDSHRILLAEDNAINALLTRTLLEAEGCHVEVVEDGQLAVEAMKTNNYDMIFMDMRMPNMDGLEATRKIRTLPNVPAGLPIVALTANAFDDDRNACFDSGMNDFMTKPVSAEELTEMVKRWAGKDADMKEAS